jgi:hypothetical protein
MAIRKCDNHVDDTQQKKPLAWQLENATLSIMLNANA